jgi:hypothetical protein
MLVMNNQQLKFLEGMLLGVQKQTFTQKEPITINVKEKHEGIHFQIEAVAGKGELIYRVHTSAGSSHYNTWNDIDEIKNSFRIMSLI